MYNKLMLNIVLCGLLSIAQVIMPMMERKLHNTGYFTNTPPNDIQAYHTYKNNKCLDNDKYEITYQDEHGQEKTIQYRNLAGYLPNENQKNYLILRQYINGITTKDAIEFPHSEIQQRKEQ